MSWETEDLETQLVKSIEKTVTTLPENTLNALKESKYKEEGGSEVQINNMIKSINISRSKKVPICQDTGTPTFFVEIGSNFPNLQKIGEIKPIIQKAVQKATKKVPLRPNSVDPITNENSGDNTGKNIPYVHWEITNSENIQINFLPKGGGSENMSQLKMLNPSKTIEDVKKSVLDKIASMGGKPCPPTVIGIGLGGGADIAMNLAKKSLLRPIGKHHKETRIEKIEKEIKEKANELGVGPMGVGGKTTVLDIKLEYANRHPASLPLGIIVQCWCNRRGSIAIEPDGRVVIEN